MLIMRRFGGDIGKDRNWGVKNIHNTKFYSEKIEALARFVLPNTKYSIHSINHSLLDWTDSHITTIL